MAITLLLPPTERVRLVKSEQIICRDPDHCHNSPVQNMAIFDINGHVVEITQDGDTFNARIDGSVARYDLTNEQLDQFVKDHV
jgi:hypothetical protein